VTLRGTATDNTYGTTPAKLVWEIPGSIRFDRNGGAASALVFNNKNGLANAASVTEVDAGILESLLDDSVEAFLYGFTKGRAYRFLGGRFRVAGGTALESTGASFDIYESVAPVEALNGAVRRRKLFYIDSLTQLPARTTYVITRGGQEVTVSTEFGNWSAQNGQSFPGQIVRKENGIVVFSYVINTAAVGSSVSDGLFGSN
jgi:hypothetical protein